MMMPPVKMNELQPSCPLLSIRPILSSVRREAARSQLRLQLGDCRAQCEQDICMSPKMPTQPRQDATNKTEARRNKQNRGKTQQTKQRQDATNKTEARRNKQNRGKTQQTKQRQDATNKTEARRNKQNRNALAWPNSTDGFWGLPQLPQGLRRSQRTR
jgi:hypothetical protein